MGNDTPTFGQKVQALFRSRRFLAALGGVSVITINHFFPTLGEDELNAISTIVIGWIVGDSLKNTD